MVGNANGKKYTMIVFEEDERYGSNGIQLGFYSDNPWEGNLSDIVEGTILRNYGKAQTGIAMRDCSICCMRMRQVRESGMEL